MGNLLFCKYLSMQNCWSNIKNYFRWIEGIFWPEKGRKPTWFRERFYEVVNSEDRTVHTLAVEWLCRSLLRSVNTEGRPRKYDETYICEYVSFHSLKFLSTSIIHPKHQPVFLLGIARVYAGKITCCRMRIVEAGCKSVVMKEKLRFC